MHDPVKQLSFVSISPRAWHRSFLLSLMVAGSVSTTHAYDDMHWFRPYFFYGEPRLEKPGLGEIKGYGAYGSSTKGKSSSKHDVPLLDLYGIQNIHDAAKGVGFSRPLSADDGLLTELAATSGGPCYAHLSCTGRFSLTEIETIITQNLRYGFFIECTIPARELRISHIVRHDLTPPQEQTAAWQAFLAQGANIFEAYNLSVADYVRSGVGDIALALGWAINYEEITTLDFLDASFQVGFVFPTSHTIIPHYLLDIPIGFNGHSAFFGIADASIGLCDWITFGTHLQLIGFTSHREQQHLKTSPEQEALFIIQPDSIRNDMGSGLTAGLYGKADHVLLGLSLTLGYSFAHKNADRWYICPHNDPYGFPDQRLRGWDMHLLHLIIDYDYATYHNPFAPKIGFAYNTALQGKQIIPISLFGGLWSMTFQWDF